MTDTIRLQRLRTFLFLLAAFLFAGTVVELILVDHDQSTIQLIPFALCGLGLVALGLVWKRSDRLTTLVVRVLMVVISAGSLFGVYEHLAGNYEFAHEIHRNASTRSLIEASLRGGAPLMAPGILAIAAAVGVAATYARIASAETAPARDKERAAVRPAASHPAD